MPDEFWFEVTSANDVFAADGETVIGRLQPNVPYRALDANEHWLAIPGPGDGRGFVAISDLDYHEIAAPDTAAQGSDDDAAEADAPVVTAATTAATLPDTPADAVETEVNESPATEKEAVSADVAPATMEEPVAAEPESTGTVGDFAAAGDESLMPAMVSPDSANGSGGDAGPTLEPPSSSDDSLTKAPGDDADHLSAGSHDTTAYVHATSEDPADHEEDPSADQRKRRMIAAGAGGFVILLIIIFSIFSGGDSTPTSTVAAPSTTEAPVATTTTTPSSPVNTTVPPIGTTPASDTAPKDWRIVFYNDFEESRDEAFPVGEITASASGALVDGSYVVDVAGQRSMETLLQIPMTSRSAYFGATIGETPLAPGAHVCGLLFSTDEELYVVTVNAEVASGPREYAVIDGSGKEVVAVTGSTDVKPGANDVAVFVRAPNMRLYINGEQVAKGKIDGKQFTAFGVTYGASSSGQCSFDDVEVWRPPPPPTTAELDSAAQTDLRNVLSGQQIHRTEQGTYTDVADELQQYEPTTVINTSSPADEGVFVELTEGSDQATFCGQQLSESGTYFAVFEIAADGGSAFFATSGEAIECPPTAEAPVSSDTVGWSAVDFPALPRSD